MGVSRRPAGWASAPLWLVFLAALAGLGCRPAAAPEPGPDLSAYPWLYLRGGLPLAEDESLVEVIAVGDIMLGRGVSGVADPLGRAAPWLGAADLAVGNFEGVLAVPGELPEQPSSSEKGPFPLLMPPGAIETLKEAGFDLLGLANNHALDHGPDGLAGTVSGLESAGLQTIGAGPDPASAWKPVFRQAGGVRLAFLACNALPNSEENRVDWAPAFCADGQAVAAIAAARDRGAAVAVLVHWGYEYDRRADPAQQALARRLIAAGADLLLGHHPHTVQGSQVLAQEDGAAAGRAGFVAYSLGNFVFDQGDPRAQEGLALRAFFDRDGLRAVQALPVRAGLQPRLVDPGTAAALVERIAPPPAVLGFACEPGGCYPVQGAMESGRGLFWSGEIDLTGDGQLELIRLAGGEAAVYEAGELVWQSDPDWQVLDVALGDPNDDGRAEVMLALIKPDPSGELRSHPFIIGYRGGRYRQLWGGSAVSSPIRELELGDVDGDGAQELVVLEAYGEAGQVALSVWRWHGWGFSLAWRSEAGAYRNLSINSGEANRPPRILVERGHTLW